MADIIAHVGEKGEAELEIHDASGNPTTNWDVEGGTQWTSTFPDSVFVSDPDANPLDAEIEFRALTSIDDAFLEVSFDAKVGPEEKRITCRSLSIAVEPGEATGGVVNVRMVQVPA